MYVQTVVYMHHKMQFLRQHIVVLHELYCLYAMNTVLRAESVSLEVEQDMYGFPEAGEAEGLNVSSGSSASISIPRQLLMDRANG